MNRTDFTLLACGGGAGKLVDTLASIDSRYISHFINTSKTDIESLDNYDDVAVNYTCISNINGMGRSRFLGKKIASKRGMNLLEVINSFNTKVIYVVTTFGGGSGSSIASVLLAGIQKLKNNGDFDKTINLIGILPSIDSSTEVLQNALETWNEIMSYNCVNNMIFIDNNNTFNGEYLEEQEINDRFAEMFDSVFDIPDVNGRNFDNGNLGRILNSQGCMYIYDLPDGSNNANLALKRADANSVLAKMYESKEGTEVDSIGNKQIKCGFIGTSFNNENYTHKDILDKYKSSKEDFTGYNEDSNLVLISGCLPPLVSIQVIQAELKDREKEEVKNSKTDFSSFIVENENVKESMSEVKEVGERKPVSTPQVRAKTKKKAMKKNIFDMF